MHELPLVFFTVFGQAAAGLLLCLLISVALGLTSAEQAARARMGALVLLIIGSAIGGLHMGQPLRALNLLAGAVRSPMSNEIILSGFFLGAAALSVLLDWRGVGQQMFGKLVHTATVLLGLMFVWSIPRVYQLDTISAWASPYTSLHMLLTVLVAGGICAALFGACRVGALVSVVGVTGTVLSKTGYVGFLTATSPLLAEQQHNWWMGQSTALLIGGGICLVLLCQPKTALTSRSTPLLAAGALIMLAGELAGRIAFYNLWAIGM